jgi:hypothetical protein
LDGEQSATGGQCCSTEKADKITCLIVLWGVIIKLITAKTPGMIL